MGLCASKEATSNPTQGTSKSSKRNKPAAEPLLQPDAVDQAAPESAPPPEEPEKKAVGDSRPQVAFEIPKKPKEAKNPPERKSKLAAHASFEVEKRTVDERYEVGKELGRGCFGVVRICTDKKTGKQWALKCIQRSSLKSHIIVQDEVMQLKKVGEHPNVVQLHDFFEDFNGDFYIVMELCRGGDLFTRIVNEGSYSESMASQLLQQLASAIKHMHDNQITHRDLKPENILLTDQSPSALVKVVDFGLSKFVNSPQGMMSTVIGTWAYCAPEVFSRRPYTDAVDNWALGVLMFIMLSGYHPFDLYGDSSEAQLIENICSGKFNFEEPEWQDVSKEAKDIITALLQQDPANRMSVESFLARPWIVGEKASTSSLNRSKKRLEINISNVFNLPPPLKEVTNEKVVLEEGPEAIKLDFS